MVYMSLKKKITGAKNCNLLISFSILNTAAS